MGNKFVVAGGWDWGESLATDRVFWYDPDTDAWFETDALAQTTEATLYLGVISDTLAIHTGLGIPDSNKIYRIVASRMGIFHVSRDGWVINANTSIYMYYDKDHADNTTYIGGVSGSLPATNVWNLNYVCAHLMNNLLDSTTHGNNLTAYGAPSVVSMFGGLGYDLDGSTQYFSMAVSPHWIVPRLCI